MALINYRKETSERSDATNWAKKMLIEKTGLFFDAIEGCNENNNNVVTHLFERARVDFVPGESLETDVLSEIILLETPEVLQRKINFANTFNCPLTYVLYCNEKEAVWVYTSIYSGKDFPTYFRRNERNPYYSHRYGLYRWKQFRW